jgi:hypothetical protein
MLVHLSGSLPSDFISRSAGCQFVARLKPGRSIQKVETVRGRDFDACLSGVVHRIVSDYDVE